MPAAYGFHVILAFVAGYLLGSVPFGIIVTRLGGGPDPRTIGSGNIGATNVLRSGKKKLAALTLLGDALKGTVAVLIGWWLGGEGTALAAGFGAFIGHLFPLWLGFRGGKGVATFLGVALALQPLGALVFAASWLVTAKVSKYSSLSALVATVATPLALWALGHGRMAALMAVLAALLWFMHRENIQRLLAGTEGKIGQKS
ncbi:MAG: glycerol-3-phosphate 1-O-acyltransferase PlsY [Hyphomicrobiales bacterium]|nr:glycerol-3-phosphate 1-O-acyltransferase PlsY [Hyphomicrobiales bacterium]